MMSRLILIVALVILTFPVVAQQNLSRLSGVVTDQQARIVPGATVRLTNITNGATRETTTSQEGVFLFPALSPDRYNLAVSQPGFAPYESKAIDVPVQTPVTINVTLTVAATTESVSVAAEASPLNSTDATIGNSFNSWQITQLPLEGRNVTALLSLQPGVAYTSDTNVIFRTNFGEADADQRNGAVNGSRSDQANVKLQCRSGQIVRRPDRNGDPLGQQ
jgi:hypothetical protein